LLKSYLCDSNIVDVHAADT